MTNLIEQAFGVEASICEVYEQAEYEIGATGEVTRETQRELDELARDRERVITALGGWFLATEAKLEGKKAEYKLLQEKINGDLQCLEDRLDYIRKHIAFLLPKQETAQIVNDRVYIYYRQSNKVRPHDPEAVPIEFTRIKTEPDLKKISAAVDAGASFPWCEIETCWNPQIKIGGEKAIKNGRTRLKKLEKEAAAKQQEATQAALAADSVSWADGSESEALEGIEADFGSEN